MASSIYLAINEQESDMVSVEGAPQPDDIAHQSGLWIAAAGAGIHKAGVAELAPFEAWTWFALESGEATLETGDDTLVLKGKECFTLPPHTTGAHLKSSSDVRIIWMRVAGPLAPLYMQKMGAVKHRVMKQGTLPTHLTLARQIVQTAVRLSSVEEPSSAQLQQLLWAMLAASSGQPVAMDAVLSHEIAKVVDAMRASQYRANFSLAEMAALSRIPVETFRKRFVAEVGMPPQSYQLFCKMERAKQLLKEGYTVRQAGAEVGMSDPYHFSKTFKNIVGMNPSTYSKQTQR